MRCPRCAGENPAASRRCGRCGAPLALGEEPAPRPLDVPLDIDRRSEPRGAAGPAADPAWEMEPPVQPRPGSRPPPVRSGAPGRRPTLPPRPVTGRMRSAGTPLPMVPSGAPTFPELSGGDPLASDPRARLTPYPGPAPAPLPQALRSRAAPPPPPIEPILTPTPTPLPVPAAVPAAEPAVEPPPAAVEPTPGVPAPGPSPEPVRRAPEPVFPAPALPPPPPRPAARSPGAVHHRRAEPWRRVVAWAVDLALVAGLVVLLLLPVLGRGDLPPDWSLDAVVDGLARRGSVLLPALLLAAVLGFAYQWLCTALAGATAGKWVAGLRVVGPDGERPLPGRSAVRSLLVLPSVALLGMGGLLALFTRSGRSAHDFLAGTWVVRAGTRSPREDRR